MMSRNGLAQSVCRFLRAVLVSCATLFSVWVWAGELHVRVAPDAIVDGQPLSLWVVWRGDDGDVGTPDFSALDKDFSVLRKQEGQHSVMLRDVPQTSHWWHFLLLPQHSGQLIIPAFKVAGATSQPLKVDVAPRDAKGLQAGSDTTLKSGVEFKGAAQLLSKNGQVHKASAAGGDSDGADAQDLTASATLRYDHDGHVVYHVELTSWVPVASVYWQDLPVGATLLQQHVDATETADSKDRYHWTGNYKLQLSGDKPVSWSPTLMVTCYGSAHPGLSSKKHAQRASHLVQWLIHYQVQYPDVALSRSHQDQTSLDQAGTVSRLISKHDGLEHAQSGVQPAEQTEQAGSAYNRVGEVVLKNGQHRLVVVGPREGRIEARHEIKRGHERMSTRWFYNIKWFSLVVLAAFLVWAYMAYGRRQPELSGSIIARLKFACKNNNPSLAREALICWAVLHWPDKSHVQLSDIAGAVDHDELAEALRALDDYITHRSEHMQWQGGALWQAFEDYQLSLNES